MPVAAATPPGQPMSWEEYTRQPETPLSEYVGGRMVMVPTPTQQHQHICRRLANALDPVIPADHDVTLSWAWKIGRDEFAPDLMVHPRTTESVRFTGTPLLVVEVLSTNRRTDLVTKTGKYAAGGARHYWIVDPRDRSLEAFDLVDGFYEPAVEVGEDAVVGVPFGETALVVDLKSLLG